jgi:hypothetical protein
LLRVGERLLARLDRALDERLDHLLELGARQLDLQVLGPARVGGEERQVDLVSCTSTARSSPSRRLLEALQDHLVLGDVDARCPS